MAHCKRTYFWVVPVYPVERRTTAFVGQPHSQRSEGREVGNRPLNGRGGGGSIGEEETSPRFSFLFFSGRFLFSVAWPKKFCRQLSVPQAGVSFWEKLVGNKKCFCDDPTKENRFCCESFFFLYTPSLKCILLVVPVPQKRQLFWLWNGFVTSIALHCSTISPRSAYWFPSTWLLVSI